jgi:hypothetical protein
MQSHEILANYLQNWPRFIIKRNNALDQIFRGVGKKEINLPSKRLHETLRLQVSSAYRSVVDLAHKQGQSARPTPHREL